MKSLGQDSSEKVQLQTEDEAPRTSATSDRKPHDLASDRVMQHSDNDSDDFADKVQYPSMWKAMLIVSGLFMGVFLVALDQTIIGTAIPKITDEFKTIQDVGWYGSAYFLTSTGNVSSPTPTCMDRLMLTLRLNKTALQPSYGRIYVSFDSKWAFLLAIFLFEVGSLICAVAPTSPVLIVGRAIAGLGVAGIFSGCTVITSFVVPLEKRPLAFSLFGAVWGAAFVAGPLLGGAFTDHVTWRWCFYINLPIGAVSAAVVLLVLNPPPRPRSEMNKSILMRVREFDLLGAVLMIAAMTCLLLALQWGGKQYTWSDGRIIGLLVGCGLLLVVFVAWQFRLGEKATLPPRIMRQRTVAAASVFVVMFGGSAVLFMFYLPIFFQSIRGSSAIMSGIQMLPMLLGLVVASGIVGALVSYFGFYTPFLIGSTAIFAVGAGLITTYNAEMADATWIGFQILAGAGLGAGFQIPQAAVQTVLDQKDIPVGSSALIFFQNLGAPSSSRSASLFSRTELAPSVDPALIFSTGATGLKQALEKVGQSSAWPSVLLAYTRGLQDAFKVGMGLGLGGLLATLFFEWRSVKDKKNNAEPAIMG
ncbi:hypothetical protein PG999_011753 [Apiospora kogelbergensis]|uniref:Major facilitator superfamily (MFS) profile domain-containing protein n=1 Tax=Apiospora kogelbergensis TaxID=1337665 RepID=A0AAW0QGJ1_9PEZI